jgi:hypothetical protein
MTSKPQIALGLMGGQIVEHHVDLASGVGVDHPIHEIEEFDASAPLIMTGRDLAGGHIEGGEQSGRAVTLVFIWPFRARPFGNLK